MNKTFAPADAIRSAFSAALSEMYRAEVPLYGDLLEIVSSVNGNERAGRIAPDDMPSASAEGDRIDVERHGAIRLGTPGELGMMRRAFAVMGMFPVDYYDLSAAGVPVHSTAFRPLSSASLSANPFRVFTSLLRLELIRDERLRDRAEEILARRDVFTPGLRASVDHFEAEGGLSDEESRVFVAELLETFRWHGEAAVDIATYRRLHAAHPLVADVVCFKGPHINHLTPRTTDIDEAQSLMRERGMDPKAVIEGPPRRDVPILLRQTSFKALRETIRFLGDEERADGTHTARFGEIEQRGAALRPAGRVLYDRLIATARTDRKADNAECLASVFAAFPDDLETLHRQGLAYFRYRMTRTGRNAASNGLMRSDGLGASIEQMVAWGWIALDPILYEDFLPVSAAGIFRSNLDGGESSGISASDGRGAFEEALGAEIVESSDLYERAERASIDEFWKEAAAARLARIPAA